VQRRWRKLRDTFNETTTPRNGWTVKALSNITLRSLLEKGHPPWPGGRLDK